MPTDTDTEDDADAYADAVVVMFEGFLVTRRSNTEEEEAAEDKDEEYEEYEEREETYGDSASSTDAWPGRPVPAASPRTFGRL